MDHREIETERYRDRELKIECKETDTAENDREVRINPLASTAIIISYEYCS